MFQPTLVRSEALPLGASRARLLLPLFVLLLVAVAVPVFTVQVPPLADYINHIARMHIIAAIDHNPLLAKFYALDWAIIPNLVMDLVVPPLERWVDIYTAGQLFVVATMTLMVTGVMAVHYAVNRVWSPWPLVAFVFLYNNILLFGLMNYLFGLGVALWGIAGWIGLRQRSPWLRALLSTAVVLVLFTCHLFAVGLYGMGLLCCEAWLYYSGRLGDRRRLMVDGAAFLLPFVPVLPLLAASPTIGLATDIYWESTGKVDGLYYIFQNYYDWFDLPMALLVTVAVIAAARARLLTFHPIGWYLLGLGVAVYMAMPRMLFSSWIADQRLPLALVFMLIGFARFDTSRRWARFALYAFILGATLPRVMVVQATWQGIEAQLGDFRSSLDQIAPGSSILVATADHPEGSDAMNMPLSHAACMAMIDRSGLVSTAFSVKGKQILAVNPAYRDRVDSEDGEPPTVSDLVATAANPPSETSRYWNNWTGKFDYVYVLYTNDHSPNPAPEQLSLLFQGPRFQLFKVTPKDDE